MDRYEEAMARFKEWERKHPNGYVIREMSEYVFPELAESEDERIRKWIIKEIKATHDFESPTSKKCVDDALAYLEKQKEQKPVQDKEEKEYVRTVKSLIADFLYGKDEIDREYYQKIYDWLDGRHIEQKPAEWSEEDKKMLEAIVGDIHCGADFNAEVIHEANKRGKWLRALRPQPHWKPSEEQMEFLKRTVDGYDITCRGQVALESLYNDLKKLM